LDVLSTLAVYRVFNQIERVFNSLPFLRGQEGKHSIRQG